MTSKLSSLQKTEWQQTFRWTVSQGIGNLPVLWSSLPIGNCCYSFCFDLAVEALVYGWQFICPGGCRSMGVFANFCFTHPWNPYHQTHCHRFGTCHPFELVAILNLSPFLDLSPFLTLSPFLKLSLFLNLSPFLILSGTPRPEIMSTCTTSHRQVVRDVIFINESIRKFKIRHH